MIPKIIHYIWLGGRPKSKLTEICINSWNRVLSDYQIKEWNESNIDLDGLCEKNAFLKKCVELKLWAFVSDYLRLLVLYREGGIYLDTDVEALRPYDELLSNRVFMGYEDGGYIGTAVIGAEKGNALIKRLLDFYDEEIWNVDFFNNPIIFRYIMEKEPKAFQECKLCDQSYFSPYVPGKNYAGTIENSETYSIHWYTANWNMSRRGYVFLNTKHIKSPVKKFAEKLRKNIGYMRRKSGVV